LRNEDVETVFIISSDVVDAGEYLELVRSYEREGFRVRNIHVERLDDRAVPGVNRIIGEINERFSRESCLILSYGRSLAPLLVACYYVYEGESPAKAINRVKRIDARFIAGEDEIAFVYKYKRFVNVVRGLIDDDFIFMPLEIEPADTPVPSGGLTAEWFDDLDKFESDQIVEKPETEPVTGEMAYPDKSESIEGRMHLSKSEALSAPAVEMVPEPVQEAARETPVIPRITLPETTQEKMPDLVEANISSPAEDSVREPAGQPAMTLDELVVDRPAMPVAGAPGVKYAGEHIEKPQTKYSVPAGVDRTDAARRKNVEELIDRRKEAAGPPAAGDTRAMMASHEKYPVTVKKEEAVPIPDKTGMDRKEEAMPAGTAGKTASGSRLGIYSIRFKLVTIISAIMVAALTGMILLATYFFKHDNELRAWENNQKISEVTGLKVKSDFLSIVERSRVLPSVLPKLGPEERAAMWENDEDFLFIGIAERSGDGGLRFIRTIFNDTLMGKSGLTMAEIDAAHRLYGKAFARSFAGEVAVHNVSQAFRVPVTGFSLPLYRDIRGETGQILVSYIRLDRLLKAFKTTGIINVFMVNDAGDIIAHPDGAMIISGGNYLKLPIVKLMMKSPLDNGQMRYDNESGEAYLGSFKKIGVGGCGVIATVEESRAFEQVYRIQRWNFYLTVIVLTIAILIVFIFGKTITSPIQRLVSATARIKEGNYHVEIEPTTKDEIGILTDSFIEMGHGLEEREKMKEAFGKFVNKEIADQVLRGEVRLGGERKDVAIFFSDIRNFTAMSEKLEPEEVVEFLNDYMTRMVKCVNDTRGVVDKYMGDAIMAVWGAPVSTGNDTENAIESALAMRRELLLFNQGRGTEKQPIIQIGCGINTGPVLAGQIGSEERMEYTVIGDPVNLASRIESLNKPFGTDILISDDSYRLVKDIYRLEPMQKISVKGKSEPQQIYAVLGRKEDPAAPGSLDELRDLLGTKEQPFRRRRDDPHQEEVKYEIIEG